MSAFFTSILLFILTFPLYSLDLPSAQISDDSLLRIELKDSWLTESPARVLGRQPSYHYLPTGEKVQVRAEAGKDEFVVIISRELFRSTKRTDQFPGWAQGSWMLRRRKDTGAGTLIRVFLRSDQYTYIQFYPFNSEKSMMDAVLYGGYVVRGLPIPVPFERLYTMQLNDVLKLAGDKFPRRYFDPNPDYYKNTRELVTQIRSQIKGLRYIDDGAIDENGNYVFISSLMRQNPKAVMTANELQTGGLNCSGFIKWLIDGITRPVTGELLAITPLKQPFGSRGSSFTIHWEEIRDPYFGLDWIRNLASYANGVLRSDSFRALEEFEVRSDNFSSVIVRENNAYEVHSYPGFFSEAGYGIEGLHPLLYTLALDQPFNFYLAAVNNEITQRTGPPLRQYYHTAALFPYFDEYGDFRIAVFESAEETSFAAFRNRYPRGHHVNLVQIPVALPFIP